MSTKFVPLAKQLLRALVTCACGLAIAQEAGAASAALRDLRPQDAAQWKQVEQATLTSNGRWLAYVLAPIPQSYFDVMDAQSGGEALVVLRSTHAAVEHRYPAGDPTNGAGALALSGQQRQAGFIRATKQASTFVSIDIATGKAHEVAGATAFKFVGTDGESVLLEQRSADAATKSLRCETRKESNDWRWRMFARTQ